MPNISKLLIEQANNYIAFPNSHVHLTHGHDSLKVNFKGEAILAGVVLP